MADTTNVEINKVQVDYVSTGADKAAADFDRVKGAQDGLTRSSDEAARVTDTLSRSTLSVQRSIDSYTRAHDPLSKALADLARGESLVTRAQQQGLAVTDATTRGLENARRRVQEMREELDKHGQSVGLNRNQLQEFGHIARASLDELGAGASPLQVIRTEGARLVQAFGEGNGGVTGTLKSMGSGLVGLLTPTRLLTGGLVAMGAAAAYAYATWESGQSRLEASMNGLGRGSGASLGQLTGLARAGAAAGGLSTNEGLGLAATYNAQGFAPDVTQGLVAQTRGYARATGTGVDDAGTTLAQAFADPAKGAEQLNRTLGFVDDRLHTTIDDLEAQGRLDDARRVLSEALNKTLADTAERSFTLAHAFEEAKNGVSNFLGRIGQYVERQVNGESLDEKIDRLTKDLATQSGPGGRGSGQFVSLQQEERAQLAAALAERDGKQQKAAEAAARQQADALSMRTGAAIGAYLPGLAQQEKLANDIGLLRGALSSPGTLAGMHVGAGLVGQAYNNAVVMQANLDPAVRQKQDYDLALASADAFSTAEKAAVEARRAELAVLRETGDVTRAQAAAQMAVNEAIAKANSDAKDRLDLAQQNHQLVGKTSYERGLAAIDNKYDGVGGLYAKDAASRSDISEAMRPVASDIKSAGQLVVDALRGVASGIGGGQSAGSLPTFARGGVGFSGALAFTFGAEGGLNRRDTNGTPSNFGINQAAYPGLDVTKISRDQAAGLYKRDYWDPIGADTMSPQMAKVAFDTAVMEGVGQAKKLIAGSNGDPNTLLDSRMDFERTLIARNPAKYGPYAQAWSNRDSGLRSDINGSAPQPGVTAPAPIASTALGSDQGAHRLERSDYITSAQQGPIDDANRALDNQNRLLDVQYSTLGKTRAQIEGAAAAQSLLNHYESEHITLSPAMEASIKAIGDRTAETAQRAEEFAKQQQQVVGAMDAFRSGFGDGLKTFVSDLQQGKSAGTAFRDVLVGVEQKIVTMGENSIVEGLFGAQGSTGGGLFSGLLGSVSKGMAGSFQGWWGGSAFAGGGVMSASGPLPLRKYAGGGIASSPQLAVFGEGARNEAYVPLPDGRSIPVSMKMPSAGSSNGVPQPTGASRQHVSQTINFNVSSPDAQSFARSEGQMTDMLARAVARGQRNR